MKQNIVYSNIWNADWCISTSDHPDLTANNKTICNLYRKQVSTSHCSHILLKHGLQYLQNYGSKTN